MLAFYEIKYIMLKFVLLNRTKRLKYIKISGIIKHGDDKLLSQRNSLTDLKSGGENPPFKLSKN